MIHLIDFIKDVAQDKNIFVCIDGIIDCQNQEDIICQQKHAKRTYTQRLWVKEDWLINTLVFFEDNEYVGIYVFDKKYPWERFLQDDRSDMAYISKEQQLYLIASFGQYQCPTLYIKKDFLANERVIDYFTKQGYNV